MENKPIFVWGHGLLGARAIDSYSRILDFEAIGQYSELIRYDARGHGTSPAGPDGSHSWPKLAGDMLGIVNNKASDQGAILGGQSMGCATALWAACQSETPLKGLILVNPPTAWETRKAQAKVWTSFAGTISTATQENIQALFTASPPFPQYVMENNPHFLDHFARNVYEMAKKNPKAMKKILVEAAMSDLPFASQIKKLSLPCLILAWEGDPVHPVSTAECLSELIPNSRYFCAKNAEDVEGWSNIISEFIKGVSSQSYPTKLSGMV